MPYLGADLVLTWCLTLAVTLAAANQESLNFPGTSPVTSPVILPYPHTLHSRHSARSRWVQVPSPPLEREGTVYLP